MRNLLAASLALLALLPSLAWAQGNSAHPTGAFTPGHALRANTPSGSPYSDAGGAAGSSQFGVGYLSEIGITAPGLPFCINDALISAPAGYHRFCLGHDEVGNARLTVDSAGGAADRTLVCDINGVRVPCLGSQASGMPSVPSTAALAMLASTYAPAVVRLDTVVGAGSPPQIYRSSLAACTLNGGAGDGGLEVEGTDGLCWVAALSGNGADPRMWAQTGTADDTATLALADAAMQSAAWPTGTAKTILVPRGTVYLRNLNLLCASVLGTGEGSSYIAPTADVTTSDVLINYTGPADGVSCPSWEVSGMTVSMPLTNQITLAMPVVQKAIRVEKDSGDRASIMGMKIHDITFIGGQSGVQASGVIGAHLYNLFGDRQYGTSFVVNGFNATTGNNVVAPTETNVIENITCKGGGAYCVSPTANAHTVPALAIRDTIVRNVYGVGMGWIAAKMCVDGVTGGGDGANYTGIVCRNARGGGLEVKSSEFTLVTPNGMRNSNVDVTCYNNLDFGSCFWMPYDVPSVTPDLVNQISGRVYATWTPPPIYVSGAYYDTGSVVTNDGNSYMAVTPGLSAGVPPTHTGILLASASVVTGGVGCPNGTGVQFQLAPGVGGVILKEVVVSGTVSGGALTNPLAVVAGIYRATSANPQDSVPIGSSCTTRPHIDIATIGTAVAADGAVQWLFIEATPVRANSFSAVTDEAVTDTELTVVAQNTAYGIFVRPTGSSDRTSRRHRYHLTADVYNACLMDGPGNDSTHPVGTVENFVLVSPWCRAQNYSSSAAVWVGHSDATFTNNWPSLLIDGGEIIADRGTAIKDRSFSTSVTPATIDIILNGTRVVGATRTIYDERSPMTIRHTGGRLATTDATNAVNPIATAANATAVLNYTAVPGTVMTNARPTSYADWDAGAGSTLNFAGRLYDGAAAAIPTRRCNYGQFIQSLTPGAGGQPVDGWYCSAPISTWTAH